MRKIYRQTSDKAVEMTKKITSWRPWAWNWCVVGFCVYLVHVCCNASAATGESSAMRLDFRGNGPWDRHVVMTNKTIAYSPEWVDETALCGWPLSAGRIRGDYDRGAKRDFCTYEAVKKGVGE